MKNKFKFFSAKRTIAPGIISIFLIMWYFKFVPRGAIIIASRSLSRQIFDYLLNFAIFFAALYLIFSLIAFIYIKLTKKN